MATIESSISTGGAAFQSNRAGMLALLERVRTCVRRAVAASKASRPRFEKRGQLLPRERVALLLDPGAPFLELCTFAALGLDKADFDKSVPGGGVICGIGQVSGIRCMISASDSGIDAGAMQPMGIDKQLRVQELTMDHTRPVDMKEVVARIADDSDFPEFGANYGRATVCGHVTLEHWPLGVVTNNGPIY